jgi:hypothetical protein
VTIVNRQQVLELPARLSSAWLAALDGSKANSRRTEIHLRSTFFIVRIDLCRAVIQEVEIAGNPLMRHCSINTVKGEVQASLAIVGLIAVNGLARELARGVKTFQDLQIVRDRQLSASPTHLPWMTLNPSNSSLWSRK